MVTIAEILHRAADKQLAWTEESWTNREKTKFSCCAISDVVFSDLTDSYENKRKLENRIWEGLKNMGLDVESSTAFSRLGYEDGGFEICEETQGARYIWLKFAALMAEEQGV